MTGGQSFLALIVPVKDNLKIFPPKATKKIKPINKRLKCLTLVK